jgi:hypothetical protein
MGMPEQLGDRGRGAGAHQPVVAAMADAHLLQLVELAQQRLPLRHDPGVAAKIFQVLLHGERQEGAEDVSADGGVG